MDSLFQDILVELTEGIEDVLSNTIRPTSVDVCIVCRAGRRAERMVGLQLK